MTVRPRHSPRIDEAAENWRWFDPASAVERATEIVPLWVAESVLNEAAAWLRTALPEEWPAALAAKAERCFARHRQLHRLVCARGNSGNAGRDNLYKFMRHWLASRLARERPALYRRLPSTYSLGVKLRAATNEKRAPCSKTR